MKNKGLFLIPALLSFVLIGWLLSLPRNNIGGSTFKTASHKKLKRGPAQDLEWGDYLRSQATAYNSGAWDPARVYQVLTENQSSWEGGAWQCMETLKNFSFTQVSGQTKKSLLGAPANATFHFNFEISDQEYQSRQRIGFAHYELPEKIMQDLNGSDPEFWNEQKWKAWDNHSAPGEKWHALQYRSRTVFNPGGPPSSLQRVLLLREVDNGTDKYDQWIQFTVHPASSSELSRTPTEGRPFNPVGQGVQRLVDFISVRHKEASPMPDEVVDEDGEYVYPLLSFRQFWRDDQGFNPQDRLAVGRGADTCYSCHANGMRWVSPYPGSVWNGKLTAQSDKTQKETLDYYTQKMNEYQKTSWGKAITPESYGPPLGKLVGCASCHNNWSNDSIADVSRGAINWGFSAGHTYHKVTANATMPMNDRGAHGVARSFVNDFLSGNPGKGITGDTARKVYHSWLKGQGNDSGNFPGLLKSVRDVGSTQLSAGDEGQKSQRLSQAVAAARHAEGTNQSYLPFLFSNSGGYSNIYRRQTRDWLLEACDLWADE